MEKPTVWCAQHDEHTLAPAKARAYELPSLSGAESDNIVILLMSLPDPSKEIIECIENAIEWFKASKIEGMKKEFFTNDEGKKRLPYGSMHRLSSPMGTLLYFRRQPSVR